MVQQPLVFFLQSGDALLGGQVQRHRAAGVVGVRRRSGTGTRDGVNSAVMVGNGNREGG